MPLLTYLMNGYRDMLAIPERFADTANLVGVPATTGSRGFGFPFMALRPCRLDIQTMYLDLIQAIRLARVH